MERTDVRCHKLKFEDVVKSAQDAAVFVLVYYGHLQKLGG